MLDLAVAVLALFVTFLIVPAFILGLGFAAAIPLFGLGFLGQIWSRGKEPREKGLTPPADLRDWREQRARDGDDLWRHTA